MPVSQSSFAPTAAESLAARGGSSRLTDAGASNASRKAEVLLNRNVCGLLAGLALVVSLAGCDVRKHASDETLPFESVSRPEISIATPGDSTVQPVYREKIVLNEVNPKFAESTIRDAYRVLGSGPQPLTGPPPATTLVVSLEGEDEEVSEGGAESDAPSKDSGATEEDAVAKTEPSSTGLFDGEFDPAEIDVSQDEVVEPSASDWRNAELVPTPLPRKEIVAEVVPTPHGIPEDSRLSRKSPLIARSRADVTSVAPGRAEPILASPVAASPTDLAAGTDSSDVPRIAASPKESVRPDSDAFLTEGTNDDGSYSSPANMEGGTRMLDQAVAAAESAALPATGMGGPVDYTKWPAPELALFVTGQQHGYIEPCGCTGLENQKGGVARRMTFATQLRDQGWELLPIDAGNLIRRFGRQAEIKFHRSLEALRKMGYVAVGFGPDDVRIGVGDLIQEAAAEKPEDAIYASANVVLLDPSLMPAYRVIERQAMKVAVTSILDPDALESTLNEEITLGDPVESAKDVIKQIKAESPNYTVLTFYGTEEAAQKLVREVPGFDMVVVAGGYGEPTYQPESIEGSQTKMILTGNKAMYVGLIGLYKDDEMRYARVPLDDSFGDAPQMRQLMSEYQFQLRDLGLENLGLKPIPHPSGEKFVGSKTCGDCHTTAFDIWENSPHFGATESLVHPGERGDVPRHFDPECISCHVTGWNAQNYYPYVSGYLELEADSHLHGNGCENCHGPGESHAAAENGEIEVTDEQREQLRAAMQLPLEKAREKCMECHDLDNSPDFHEEGAFDEYWAEVEHYGVD